MSRAFETKEIANQATYARDRQPPEQKNLRSAFEVTGLFFEKPEGRDGKEIVFQSLNLSNIQADEFIPAFEKATDSKLERVDEKSRTKVHLSTLPDEERLTTKTLNAWHINTVDEKNIYLIETQVLGEEKPDLRWVRAKIEQPSQ